MTTIAERIQIATAKYEAENPTLAEMEAVRNNKHAGLTCEQRGVHYRRELAVRDVVWNQILTEWLIANSIPENLWFRYEYDGDSVRLIP